MKALKFFLISIFAMVAMTSCEEYYTTEEYYSYEVWTTDFEVTDKHWQNRKNEFGRYFECEVQNVPLSNAYDNGIITVDLFLIDENGNETLTPLPYTVYEIDGEGIPYSIHYSYEAQANGKLYITAFVNDYATKGIKPINAWFKVALMW